MPSHRNTATASARPEHPLGTVRTQTSPGPGPAGDPGRQPQTPPDASTRGHQPAAPTQATREPHPHHCPPIQPTEGPTHAPSDGRPSQTCTATPTDATSTRPEGPLGTMRPHTHIPSGSSSPQAQVTPSMSAPGYHPPAPAQAKPAAQQRHDPPVGPAVQPTEPTSGSPPAPSPDPDPDPTHTTVPTDASGANAPPCELPTGVPHPDGGTSTARPAAAEGNGGKRALAGHMGGQPRPAPVQDGRTKEATQLADDAATLPAPPAQPQRMEPTLDATEETEGPPQRKEAPLPAADLSSRGQPRAEIPSGVTDEPKNQHTNTPANRPPDMAARRSSESADAGQPGTGPGGRTPDAEHAAGLPPLTTHGPQTAGHAGAAPFTTPARRRDAGASGDAAPREVPTRGPPRAHAVSEARATTADMPRRAADRGTSPGGHTRDEDSFDAFMESCRGAPDQDPTLAAPQGHQEPRDDHTGGTPLTVSRQAHLQRDYAALEAKTEHAAATGDGHATASGAADQTPDQTPRHSAQGSRTRVEMGTNTASEPADQRPGTTPSWGRGHLDYARSEGDTRRLSADGEQAAAQGLDPRIDRITTGERLALAAYFAIPPPRGGNLHHGGRRLRKWGRIARTPHHHGPPRPVALRCHPGHGAYEDL